MMAISRSFAAGLTCTLIVSASRSDSPKNTPEPARLGLPNYSILNINNITTWMRSDGISNRSPAGRGAVFPRGTGLVIFQDGFVWGAKAFLDSNFTIPAPRQLIRVGGTTYNTGNRAGWVIGQGSGAVPVDPNDPGARMYRIRRDYAQMTPLELREDAADFFEVPIANVTQAQVDSIYNQYHTDWSSWPQHLGAPYIERNGSAGFQPPPPFGPNFTVDSLLAGGYDEPGASGSASAHPADQLIWTVFNDLDTTTSRSLYGSDPLGLEIQLTLWGYKRTDGLGDVYFKRYRLINKGGVVRDTTNGEKGYLHLDSVFVTLWSDPDLGAFGDDLAGNDSVQGMGFVYNGNPLDNVFTQHGLIPPAIAYDMSLGPLVPGSPADSGIFDFRRVYGMRNQRMTSFTLHGSGTGVSEPPFGTYEGSLRWWRWFQGYAPDPSWNPWRMYYSGPFSPSFFPFWGDPLTATGWVDGLGQAHSLAAGDRRFTMNSGPFRVAPGDTQEVVIAVMGGMGTNHRASVAEAKRTGTMVQSFANGIFTRTMPPTTSRVTYPNDSSANVRLGVDSRQHPSDSVRAELRTKSGVMFSSFQMYDDGTHGDSLAGDQIWTNVVLAPRQRQGASASVTTRDMSGSYVWVNAVEFITTAGPFELSQAYVFADNINNNGLANPGENVRYGFTSRNATTFTVGGLGVYIPSQLSRFIASMSPGARDSMVYNPSNPQSYFWVNIPSGFSDSVMLIPVQIRDSSNNLWSLEVALRVVQDTVTLHRSLLTHVSGLADGEFEILVVNPGLVLNHVYVIRGVDSINVDRVRGFTLKDSTDGRILLQNHPLPDTIGHNVPVTDGFRVRRGTIEYDYGVRSWSVPNGQLRFAWEGATGLFGSSPSAGFGGAIDFASPRSVFSGGWKPLRLRNVLLRLAPTDVNGNFNPSDLDVSFAYRYGRSFSSPPARPEFAPFIINPSTGYAYQQFLKSIPLSAWDVESNPPRRLAIGHLENNVYYGLVNGRWWAGWPGDSVYNNNVSAAGQREWLWISDATYSETSDPIFQAEAINSNAPFMLFMTFQRNANTGFQQGDEFFVQGKHPPASDDAWLFNPTIVLGIGATGQPYTFELQQNYPNPFNPTTTLRYQVAEASHVRLVIYNVLGQRVKSLVDDVVSPGNHTVVWHGTSSQGASVASGVYFYRLEASGVSSRGTSFVSVRKMMLLR